MKNLWLLLPLLLAACGPQLRTNYQLLPPKTQSGQICANNCMLMSNTCVQNCRLMAMQCNNVDYDRDYGFGSGLGFDTGGHYRSGGFVGARFAQPLPSAECSSTRCENNCLAAARQCHTNCGGTITQQTICVANCPKPQPIAPQQ